MKGEKYKVVVDGEERFAGTHEQCEDVAYDFWADNEVGLIDIGEIKIDEC